MGSSRQVLFPKTSDTLSRKSNFPMAGVAAFNHIPCKTLSITSSSSSSQRQLVPKKSVLIGAGPVKGLKWRKTGFAVRVVDRNDEWGIDPKEGGADVATAVVKEPTEVDKLKRALVDSLYGTDRGLKASSETRAEIVELITQLEAKNPTPAPTEAITLLNGKWILAYTSFSELFPLLAAGTLPLVKVEEISQTIDSASFTVQNSVQFSGPLATTSVSTDAKFEVRSPKRVQIKFEQGIIGTPQLTDSIVIPDNMQVLGQNIDLSPFKGLISSVQDAAASVVKTISDRPPLKFPISTDRAQSWLLTTYLDEELRISRGDGSSVFVLIKEGSSLLKP